MSPDVPRCFKNPAECIPVCLWHTEGQYREFCYLSDSSGQSWLPGFWQSSSQPPPLLSVCRPHLLHQQLLHATSYITSTLLPLSPSPPFVPPSFFRSLSRTFIGFPYSRPYKLSSVLPLFISPHRPHISCHLPSSPFIYRFSRTQLNPRPPSCSLLCN